MQRAFSVCVGAFVALLTGFSPGLRAQEAGPEVGMWDRFDLAVANSKVYASPYADVVLNLTYIRPDGSQFAYWGFYDGGSVWRARMMCDALGTWRYSARFSDGQPGQDGTFTCVPSDLPGRLAQDTGNPRWLGFSSGKHQLMRGMQVGDRFFASNWPDESRQAFLNWARQQGYNLLSIASHLLNRMEEGRGLGWATPVLWPLDAAEYRKMEIGRAHV
jgi:hypothetical protein